LVVETTGGFGIALRAFLKRVIATIIRKKRRLRESIPREYQEVGSETC
jgi:hypothetical protein